MTFRGIENKIIVILSLAVIFDQVSLTIEEKLTDTGMNDDASEYYVTIKMNSNIFYNIYKLFLCSSETV